MRVRRLAVYWAFFLAEARIRWQHRTAWVLMRVSQILSYGAAFLMIYIMVEKFGSIGDWSAPEVLFLYAVNLICYALGGFFFQIPSDSLPNLVRSGEFDLLMVRPLTPLEFLVFRQLSSGYAGHLVIAVIVLGLSVRALGIELGAAGMGYLLLVIVGGSFIHGSMFLITAVPTFWMVQNQAIRSILQYQMSSFVRYPISIYHRIVQVVLTFVVPYGFVSYYPAQEFLGRNEFLGFAPIVRYLSVPVGVLFFFVALGIWRWGLRRYSGTGS